MISVSGGAASRAVKTRQTGETKVPAASGADPWASGSAFIAPVNPLKCQVNYKAVSDTGTDGDWVKAHALGDDVHSAIQASAYVAVSGDGTQLNYRQAGMRGASTNVTVGNVVIFWEVIEYE